MSRKHLAMILGLVLLAGLAYAFYPLTVGRSQMRKFCGGVKIGAPKQELERAVADSGYQVIFGKERIALVRDSRSFGRFLCEVELADGRLVSATYRDND
jgi:hypothetical protein